ncbi:putative indole-3-glycerol phosphate synthase [Magnetofaba australis IT-1]|uniref:indole-3-glycerol-phosphate synthase n=2 Tax=Magnetofaba TaxID=1472292 RepID=A0A1Y2K7H2_9PROT|nr:putative indole-3-glycerol phosphate synthase [Magnetofaba australis IT-1]
MEKAGLGENAVIAEVKMASPSKGRIFPAEKKFDPAAIAAGYAEHGAACISCLTDHDFFQGHEEYLTAIRESVAAPVLRKDFLYDPYQVLEARAMGADAILLIMAVLSVPQAQELEAAALDQGLDVLVEVHDEAELDAAHELKTPLMGVNNRNLRTFETSLETTVRLGERAEKSRLLVSESGIHSATDIRMLNAHGVRAFLIGEAFMKSGDPGPALGALLSEAAV